MVDSVFRAPDSGAVGMPSISPGMTKVGPTARGGGKGSDDDKEFTRLGQDKDDDEEQELLDRARKRMDKAIQAEGDNRRAALDDLKLQREHETQNKQIEFECIQCRTRDIMVPRRLLNAAFRIVSWTKESGKNQKMRHSTAGINEIDEQKYTSSKTWSYFLS